MRNIKTSKKTYKKLIDKIFLQTLGLFIIATVIVFFIRSIGQGEIGDIITNIIRYIYDVDLESARLMYFQKFRSNIDIIIVGTIIILFAIFYKVFLSWFTKYFDEMIAGVNGIANREQKISMSPELRFMEDTLNQIKSDLEKSEQAESELEARKNELVMFLAHDIKTPLTSVIGYLGLLDETPDMPIEQKAKYVNITLKKAYRLEKLINEFFEIARYNLNSVLLNIEQIDLSYMLVQIADEAYPQLTASEKEVTLNTPQDLLLNADSEKMARVFNNLLKNAIAYSTNNSVIEISAESKENNVEICFRNQGMIPQDKLDTIFDKFSRLDDARQSATGGAGLGLAIAKDIITLHGGTIYASSDQSHSTIVIEMPSTSHAK